MPTPHLPQQPATSANILTATRAFAGRIGPMYSLGPSVSSMLPCVYHRVNTSGMVVAIVIFLEIMIMLFMMMIMMLLTASPKIQTRHGHFLPKGLGRASSPLTVASRRKPMIHVGGIYTDENTDSVGSHCIQTG